MQKLFIVLRIFLNEIFGFFVIIIETERSTSPIVLLDDEVANLLPIEISPMFSTSNPEKTNEQNSSIGSMKTSSVIDEKKRRDKRQRHAHSSDKTAFNEIFVILEDICYSYGNMAKRPSSTSTSAFL